MTCQGLNLLHTGVLPQDDLIERVAMGAYDLMRRL